MRIAHVLMSLQMGGGESVALALAAAQRAQGHDVFVVSLTGPDGAMAERFQAAGLTPHVLRKRHGLDPSLYARLLVFFVSNRIEVVHTHNPQSLVYAAPAGYLAGRTVVHTKHGEAMASGRRFWLLRQAARFTNAFVAVSHQTAARSRQIHEAPCRKLHVIENGIDLSRFQPDGEARRWLRAELGVSESTRICGTVGRLADVKNHDLLIRAAAPLLGPEVLLVLVGDGPERQPLQGLAVRLGQVREIRFLGQRSDVARIMAGLDLFVMSSDSEGLPLVLIEAMAIGLPVVCTAVGGIPEVIEDGVCGLLVPKGDAERLGQCIARVLAEPDLARSLGDRARERALDRYSLDRMVARYTALYSACGRQ